MREAGDHMEIKTLRYSCLSNDLVEPWRQVRKTAAGRREGERNKRGEKELGRKGKEGEEESGTSGTAGGHI